LLQVGNHLDRHEPPALGAGDRFQFFPSCCQEYVALLNKYAAEPFNSFPVAACPAFTVCESNLNLSILSQLLLEQRSHGLWLVPVASFLSILSQLLLAARKSSTGSSSGRRGARTFNSFPVAAVRVSAATERLRPPRPRGAEGRFQFFPSCCLN
jgi:hypothetical protein